VTYTAVATPEAEARVAADLDRVVAAVRAQARDDILLAVFLVGGYARGEGAVVEGDDGALHGFNDYDFLLLFDRPPADPAGFSRLAGDLAGELSIDFVDLGLATPTDLAAARPTLFWFEVGEAHRELWRAPGCRDELPRFRVESLDPAEGSRLLVNRGMSLLWVVRRLWPDRPLDAPPAIEDVAQVRFSTIAAHKAVAASGDAALLRAGVYRVSQAARIDTLAARPDLLAWAEPGFLDAYRASAAFRREPVLDADGVGALWRAARVHHEAGFRAAERARLGRDFSGWDAHARLAAARMGEERLRRPRLLKPWVRRGFSRDAWWTGEETRFLDLARLLYHAAPESRDWVEAADRLIGEWHD